MHIRRTVVAAAGALLAATGLVAPAATAAPSGATARFPSVSLSRPLMLAPGKSAPPAAAGMRALYSTNWSGYAALPATAGDTFTSVVGNYTVPAVDCAATPNTFSYHWIGLDGWLSGTVEQDGVAADCNGTTPDYAAWFEMYPAPFHFAFDVHPGDAIESAVQVLRSGKYELSLKDLTTGGGFDVVRACPVTTCANSSAEAITEAYYFNRRYSGTSAFGDEHYANVSVTDAAGNYGGLRSSAWRTVETIALGRYGAVDTTPGPLANTSGFHGASAFSVFWSRKD